VPAISCIVVAPSLLRESSELKRIKASFNLSLPGWRGQKVSGKVLSIILISAIAGAIGALGYFATAPNVGEKSTEFYILGLEGKAHEHAEVTYRVEIVVDGVKSSDLEPVTLGHNEKWEKVVTFVPDRPGDNQKVEFLLYRLDQNDVYHRVHLWIDITAP